MSANRIIQGEFQCPTVNYTLITFGSSCTTLDGAVQSYNNAFSLIVPGILDAGYLLRDGSGRVDVKGIQDWSITVEGEAFLFI